MNLSSKTFFRAGVAAVAAAFALSARAVNPGNLPLWFEAGPAHADGSTEFITHGRDAEFSITPVGAKFTLRQADGRQAAAQMTFVGAATSARLSGDGTLPGKINYLLGNNPAQWQTGIPTFAKVRLDQVYPGVDVVYYGNQQTLEYDFNLAAGVDPQTIAIRFDGAEKISLNPAGELVIQLAGGQVIQHAPVAYQTISGERHAVQASYQILDAHTVAFTVGAFNHSQALVIDPVLGYSSFFGGNSGEKAWALAIDGNDNSIFIAGQTFSTLVSNGPPVLRFATTNAYATTNSGGTQAGDAFVARFDSTGTNLLYCTYLGGSGDDAIYAIAVDNSGNAFVTGATESTNFPVKNAAHAGTYDGSHIAGVKDNNIGAFPTDAFVTELEPNGTNLVYSTYLGGTEFESAFGIATDMAGTAFVTGYTTSTNFPISGVPWQSRLACSNLIYVCGNAFVTEIAPGGNQLNYSTFLGGTNFDEGRAIAYNSAKVFVAGYTISTNFPWTNGLIACTNLNGFTNRSAGSDAFVSMFATSGTNLVLQYSTFLGSSNNDIANGITADSAGNAYVVGWTTSTNFPNSTNGVILNSVVQTNASGFVFATNAFLTKIAWNGTKASNSFSRIFGGLGVDVANGVARDPITGNIFVVGSASSTNFPVTAANIFGSLKSTNTGFSDAFVTVFAADLQTLLYSTYLGGAGDDFGQGIALDSAGNAWVTGQTLSTNFPVFGTWSTNFPALHRTMVGTNDAFLTKILTVMPAPASPLSISPAGTNVLLSWTPASGIETPPPFPLETTTNLLKTNWAVIISSSPVLTNGNYIYTFTHTNPVRFFRFHKY